MITAAHIRSARERVDETQEEFAARFGLDQSTISRWETEGPPDQGPAKALIQRVLLEIKRQVGR
jgi:DNA-binding transcriptional regulator YiaG